MTSSSTEPISVQSAVTCGLITSLVALLGALFGTLHISDRDESTYLGSLTHWDGKYLREIAETEYRDSLVTFFPAVPLAARCLARSTGMDTATALVLIPNICFLAACGVFALYLNWRAVPIVRCDYSALAATDQSVTTYALLAMSVIPASFFFRMAYTEGVFLSVALVAMLGISRGWPLLCIAFIVGLATATRPVGVALLFPLGRYIIDTSPTTLSCLKRLCWAVPLGCWGVIAFASFLNWDRGEPFAFASEQQNWHVRLVGPASDKILALLSWEPIWSIYLPIDPCVLNEPRVC